MPRATFGRTDGGSGARAIGARGVRGEQGQQRDRGGAEQRDDGQRADRPRQPARRRRQRQHDGRADGHQRHHVREALRQRRGENVGRLEPALRTDHERADELAGPSGQKIVAEVAGRGRPEHGRKRQRLGPAEAGRHETAAVRVQQHPPAERPQQQRRRRDGGDGGEIPGRRAGGEARHFAPVDAPQRVVQEHRGQHDGHADRDQSGVSAVRCRGHQKNRA